MSRSHEQRDRQVAELVAELVVSGEATLSADGFTVGRRTCHYCGERIAGGVEVDGRLPMHPICATRSCPEGGR
jgi:hypothetical protein